MLRFLLAIILLLGFCHVLGAAEQQQQKKTTYIVHMAKHETPASFDQHSDWYDSSLKSVSDSAEMLYTYNTVMHGFSTRLSPEEAESLSNLPGVLSVLPQTRYELHTTRTPQFLGLDKLKGSFPESDSVSDVVIGVLDTGVWPERKSFDDKGLGPVPSGWKGECQIGKNFNSSNCNRKLIGARFFSKGYESAVGPIDESKESKSPRDDDGHGTHTSTTAGGSIVENASLFGYAAGTARGMSTRARIAVYKICWIVGCFSADVLAGMEKAIEDGVNILSISLGGGTNDFFKDSVAIGAFAAMEKGVLVSCSAGNAGPNPYSTANVAPWINTVGAGTLDRDFPAYISLGNGKNFSGASLYSGKPLSDTLLPFIYAGNATNSTKGNFCIEGTLLPEKIAGKLVLCDRGLGARVEKGQVVKDAGGAGMILANTESNGEELIADAFLSPAAIVGHKTGKIIKEYLLSDSNPTATIIFGGTKVGIQPSPMVAAFSSRGPNSITRELLKPDMIAPGLNILAGWSGGAGPTELEVDKRRVEFNIISGTSMSCPHVSGLAALLKAAHPDWSPSALRSALMTTAYTAYKTGEEKLIDIANGKPSTPFDYGAGHVDPVSALDPGLIYDNTVDDYLNYLCALDYSATQIGIIAKRSFTCDTSKKYSVTDLNYPSFAVVFKSGNGSALIKYSRTLTNVGTPGTYKVSVSPTLESVKVTVEPDSVSFKEQNEKKTYTVSFEASSMKPGTNMFTRLVWSDGKHNVGSPIALSWT